MSPSRADQGRTAEARAEEHLCGHGLHLVARNYRCRFGELDLIMRDGDALVVVEVRSRSHTGFMSPAESVSVHKQRRLIATARHLLARFPVLASRPLRFDVVAITEDDGKPRVEWLVDAFRPAS